MTITPHGSSTTTTLHHGDCLDILRELPDNSVDSVVTDPPYGLEFMGKAWDRLDNIGQASHQGFTDGSGFKGFRLPTGYNASANLKCLTCDKWKFDHVGRKCECGPAAVWPNVKAHQAREMQEWHSRWVTECLRVLKPGGHLLAFGGTRTWHRLACAVEDAGFEVRDSIAWMYASGFPKSLNASKALKESGRACTCPEPATQHDMPGVSGGNVSTPLPARARAGAVLLEGVPEQGTSADRSSSGRGHEGSAEPSLEGRRHTQAPEGELRGGQVHPLPAGVPGDGASGRLHHGAPASDGSMARSLPTAVGGREPQGSRPVEQPPGEPGAVPVERGSQAWGGWPVCERCSQPVIPDGLGTAAKPAFDPVVVARKPLAGTVAANVLAHGTGALNVDGCRVEATDKAAFPTGIVSETERVFGGGAGMYADRPRPADTNPAGRWPANVVLDESQAAALDQQSGERKASGVYAGDGSRMPGEHATDFGGDSRPASMFDDQGGASRFFYTAKADATERVRINGTAHPTVKPLALMRWLVRLVTPPGGTVLEPFAGSGTTVEACILEGFRCIAIEREADYLPLIMQRINRRVDPVAAVAASGEDGGLFDLLDASSA